jgi:serpin B
VDASATRTGYRELISRITGKNGNNSIKTANAFWAERTYPSLPDYVHLAGTWYGTKMINLDLKNNPDLAAKSINSWISEETGGKIPEMIESLTPDTRPVLTNAIYFKSICVDSG